MKDFQEKPIFFNIKWKIIKKLSKATTTRIKKKAALAFDQFLKLQSLKNL